MNRKERNEFRPFQLGMRLDLPGRKASAQENHGVVYTKPWVVELILDMAGYDPATNLVDTLAVEPAAGQGAFLIPMTRRLAASCKRQDRSFLDIARSLIAYELDESSACLARSAVTKALVKTGVAEPEANIIANGWVRTADYLADACILPPADFVIGNPPYIRLEDMDEVVASTYRAAYRTMKGRADIYVAFFEAALQQLQPGGVCAFICADRWMLNQYGSELRRLVTTGYGVDAVLEMHSADAFDTTVSAYPAITVIRRGQQGPAVVASAGPVAELIEPLKLAESLQAIRAHGDGLEIATGVKATRIESWFQGSDPWPHIAPERLALLKRLEADFDPLESTETATKVGIGVATGLDDVFITRDGEVVESSRLLPLAMASDTNSGTLRWSGHYLVDPWIATGLVDLTQFPRLAAHYGRHRERLQQRHVGRRNPRQWYRTIDRVNHTLTGKRKLYIPDIKNTIQPVLDTGRTYPHHNLYFVQSDVWDVEVLGGLLLSAVGQFFVECYGVRMRGGYLRFQAQYLRRIRVPRPADISAAQSAGLIDAFRRRDVALVTRIALDVYRIATLPMAPSETTRGY